jgi:hypothetical protein
MPVARIVFILGAGASQSTGAPLMRDFMARIRDLRESGLAQESRPSFDLVWNAFLALKSVHANVQMDYQGNIEDLFATFEMARILGRLGSLDRALLVRLPDAMREVIATTIELGMPFPVGSDGWIHPHTDYDSFARMIRLRTDAHPHTLALITFNYDIGLDYALEAYGVPYDYCLAHPAKSQIPYLKLHGSLNWRSDAPDGAISAIPVKVRKINEYTAGAERLVIRASQWKTPGSVAPASPPFIVPPTWNKTEYHERVDAVWRRAADELADAVVVFVVGYSAPLTDEFFRHLFALGLAAGGVMDRIWVVNPSSDAYTRIKDMLSGPLQKIAEFISGDFRGQMDRIAQIVGLEGDALAKWREGKV